LQARVIGISALSEGLAGSRVLEETTCVGDLTGLSYSRNPSLQ